MEERGYPIGSYKELKKELDQILTVVSNLKGKTTNEEILTELNKVAGIVEVVRKTEMHTGPWSISGPQKVLVRAKNRLIAIERLDIDKDAEKAKKELERAKRMLIPLQEQGRY